MRKITYNTHYRDYKINTNAEKTYGCYTDGLDIYLDHLESMCAKYSKVFQLRFDLRYPDDNSVEYKPRQLSVFQENLTKDLKRNCRIYPKKTDPNKPSSRNRKHDVDPRIIKACEIGKNNNKVHVHGLLLLNGHAKDAGSVGDLQKRIERQWANALGISQPTDNIKDESTAVTGLVDYCNQYGTNHYMIERNKPDFEQVKNEASHQASYIFKTRDKEGLAKGSWMVTASRLPRQANNGSYNNENNTATGV